LLSLSNWVSLSNLLNLLNLSNWLNLLNLSNPLKAIAKCPSLFLGSLLLTCHGSPTTPTRPGVRPSSLSTYRQAHPVTTTSVATDVHQAFDVHGFPTAQVTFDLIVTFDGFPQTGDIGITQIFDAGVGVHASFGENFLGAGRTDAIDVGQTNLNAFVSWEVYSGNACHVSNLSS
jgi:hypothetical protein